MLHSAVRTPICQIVPVSRGVYGGGGAWVGVDELLNDNDVVEGDVLAVDENYKPVDWGGMSAERNCP